MHKAILFVLTLTVVSFADWQTIEDDWYGLTISGAKSGWLHATVEEDDDQFRTTSTQELQLSRGGMVIEVKVVSEFVETKDGSPVSVRTSQEAMGQTSESTWTFTDSEIEITSVAGGVPITKRVPVPEGNWMTPRTIDRYFKEQLKRGAAAVTYQTLSPEMGTEIVTVVLTKLSEEDGSVMGETLRLSKWKSENDVLPVVGTDMYDENGRKIESVINAGFGEMKNTLTTKKAAQSPVGEIPEMMVSQFIEPSSAIPSDPSPQRISMIARSKDGVAVSLPTCGYQVTSQNADGSSNVVVDLSKANPALAEEVNNPKYMESTALCDASDAEVIALTQRALKDLPATASKGDIAETLRAFTYRFITNKGFGNAFASASQVARDPSGDCSEHGVLLCALLRAAQIPSRGVMGIVYIAPDVADFGHPNGVFGWHFWSQAQIDGKWIDLDATMPNAYTVGHVASATSPLQAESVNADMASIMALLGNTEIDIVEIDGK
ncbi:MAG: transglutaminase-like domain-containing protein [Phycisphaerales bacterium]|nr:transglutaminase-like domain-containing protein [Phycisphaerales bacterium]